MLNANIYLPLFNIFENITITIRLALTKINNTVKLIFSDWFSIISVNYINEV
jgi:hypothetical protein